MQEAQRLRWVRDQGAASTGRQLSDAQWAEAAVAGLRSPEALEAALRDGAIVQRSASSESTTASWCPSLESSPVRYRP